MVFKIHKVSPSNDLVLSEATLSQGYDAFPTIVAGLDRGSSFQSILRRLSLFKVLAFSLFEFSRNVNIGQDFVGGGLASRKTFYHLTHFI